MFVGLPSFFLVYATRRRTLCLDIEIPQFISTRAPLRGQNEKSNPSITDLFSHFSCPCFFRNSRPVESRDISFSQNVPAWSQGCTWSRRSLYEFDGSLKSAVSPLQLRRPKSPALSKISKPGEFDQNQLAAVFLEAPETGAEY